MKDLKESCRTLRCEQQGNSTIIILAAVALVVAGVLGFLVGKNSGSVSMGTAQTASNAALFKADDTASAGQPNPVVARVNGSEIKRQEVIDLMNAMPPQMRQVPVEQLYPMALEQVIGNRLADSRASMSALEKDADVQRQLWQAKQQIIRTNFVAKSVAARVSDDAIRAEYDKYVENFPEIEEVKAAHILVDDEKTAKDLIRQLDSGADFATLAKDNSKDGSAERGGELGYFAKTEVVPEFADAAFSTEVGSYTKKPVKSQFGYHIVRVEEKRIRPPATFDRIQPLIRQELERKELQSMLNEWKEAANIERYDINGNPIKAAAAAPASTGNDVEAASAEPEAGVEAAEPAAGDEAASDAAAQDAAAE